MKATRRSVVFGSLALAACGSASVRSGATQVHVMGTIHHRHRTSKTYSLAIIEAAIRKAWPDIVLTEIPPDRIGQALSSFRETGTVDEPRTQLFPEYTDVLFPLSRELGFEVGGTAAWTQEIADNRRAALDRIRNDPARAGQWSRHREAQREFARKAAGRTDDPLFVHTNEYDAIVEASRTPYERHFASDLGNGGWGAINDAHNALINAQFDRISGQGMTALITFGTAHKYKILENLARRDDLVILDTRGLFM